jgi:hypothetical protein
LKTSDCLVRHAPRVLFWKDIINVKRFPAIAFVTVTFVSLALPRTGVRTAAVAAEPGAAIPVPAADTAGARADAYKAASKQNVASLMQYSWNMRVALTVKGDAKAPQVFQMRFDRDGRLQKTLMTAPEPEKKARGIRGRIAAGKKQEFKEFIAELGDVVKDYTTPSAGTMMDFYSKASFTPLPDGTTRAAAGGFLKQSDSVEFQLDPATGQPSKFGFTTKVDGNPVRGAVEYDRVKDGPRYAARITVVVPNKEMSAVVETFNYVRQ